MSLPTTAARRIPATGQPQVRLIQKAGAKPQMAVYDAAGNLVGVVDPDKVQTLATPPGQPGKPSQADIEANAARVKANAAQQQAAEDVAKACADALGGLKPRPATVRKAAALTVTEGFADLVKSLDPTAAARVKAAVSHQGMRLMVGHGIPAGKALNIAKRTMLLTARSRGLV